MTDELKIVAWTNEAQLGFMADTKWSGIPMAMWGERECYAQPDIALCRHDEAMAEIERMTNERDAAFAMSRCECGTDEACTNLVAKDDEIERLREQLVRMVDIAEERLFDIERLQAEVDRLQRLFTQAGEQLDKCRKELAGSDENTLLRHLAYIRQKSGVGMKPMLSELADAIADRIAEARNTGLDDAAAVIEAISHEGLHESMWRTKFAGAAERIRALKEEE